jgi:hypothetical protein
MRVIERWRDEAIRADRMIARIVLAYEAGRDWFWLAGWMRAHGVEVHVIDDPDLCPIFAPSLATMGRARNPPFLNLPVLSHKR